MNTFTFTNPPPTIRELMLDIQEFISGCNIPDPDNFTSEYYLLLPGSGEIFLVNDHPFFTKFSSPCFGARNGDYLKNILKSSGINIDTASNAIELCNKLKKLTVEFPKFVIVEEQFFPIEIFSDATQTEEFKFALEKIYSPELAKLITEVNCLANKSHRPDLCVTEGGVHKIWNDGTITWEKSGKDLYGKRSLIDLKFPIFFRSNKKILHLVFPFYDLSTDYSYAVVTRPDADLIREKMEKINMLV